MSPEGYKQLTKVEGSFTVNLPANQSALVEEEQRIQAAIQQLWPMIYEKWGTPPASLRLVICNPTPNSLTPWFWNERLTTNEDWSRCHAD